MNTEAESCANCGIEEEHPLNPLVELGKHWYCETCAEDMGVCSKCKEEQKAEDMRSIDENGEVIFCPECADDEIVTCCSCQTEVYDDPSLWGRGDVYDPGWSTVNPLGTYSNEHICIECLGEISHCDYCGEYFETYDEMLIVGYCSAGAELHSAIDNLTDWTINNMDDCPDEWKKLYQEYLSVYMSDEGCCVNCLDLKARAEEYVKDNLLEALLDPTVPLEWCGDGDEPKKVLWPTDQAALPGMEKKTGWHFANYDPFGEESLR